LTLANRITLSRIAFIPLCIIFLLAGLYGLATIIFLLLSFSDALDGYIARKHRHVSDLGKKLDPLADKILVTTVLIGLTGLGKAHPIAVMIICARELLVASFRNNRSFAASPLAKWKTATQVLAVVMLMLNIPFADGMLWIAVLLSLITGGAYLWRTDLFNQLR